MVCLSVCLFFLCMSRSYIVLKRQKISTRFLLLRRRQSPCLSKIVLKFGVHRSTHSFPNFFPNWPIICWFERRTHSMANCDRMVRDSATVTMESQQKTTIGLSIVPSLTAYDLPFRPKWGSQIYRPRATSRRVLPPGEYDRRAASPFAKLLSNCPLLQVMPTLWLRTV